MGESVHNCAVRKLAAAELVLDWGPGNDKSQAKELMTKASKATLLKRNCMRMRVMMRSGCMTSAGWTGAQKA